MKECRFSYFVFFLIIFGFSITTEKKKKACEIFDRDSTELTDSFNLGENWHHNNTDFS